MPCSEGTRRTTLHHLGRYTRPAFHAQVPGADNGSADGTLGAWCQRDRVLDGDPFFIRIVP
ncbi:hypothetical protein ACF09C_10710 [Streptomyces sp. NPDC014870]|uniref:hypothetical protein n=1 Tax=Streptomyces sp. NPDC014870 TaxID=3364925 RepID=UPI0037031D83